MNRVLYAIGGIGAVVALSICPLCKSPANAAVVSTPRRAVAVQPIRAVPRTVKLHVEGMTCGGCVFSARKVLTRLDGVTAADVSYEKREAIVSYDDAKVNVDEMIAAIRTLGYTASVVAPPAS